MSFLAFNSLYRSSFRRPRRQQPAPGLRKLPTIGVPEKTAAEEAEEKSWTEQMAGSQACRRKYKLWEETQGMCIYCGKSISADDFVLGIDSDIEHIIPASLGGRSVLSNLACSCRKCNRLKGNLTAMDYMLGRKPLELQQYLMRLRLLLAAGLITAEKYHNLTYPKSLITLCYERPL